MGISNIIPGVSGGTMAVSLGIYDQMIHALTHIKSDWKKSLRLLAPIGIGMGLGIVAFSYIIELLLSQYPLPTALAFIGLILGGVPVLVHAYQHALKQAHASFTLGHVSLFLMMFSLVTAMSFIKEPSTSLTPLTTSASSLIALFFVGILTSSTMVVPGISGSLVLMIIGYYYSLLHSITGWIDAVRGVNLDQFLHYTILILPFGIGFLLGIVLISKIIDYLFSRFPAATYSAILGLVVSSPVAILVNTNAWKHLTTDNFLRILLGILLALAGFFLTYYMGTKESPST